MSFRDDPGRKGTVRLVNEDEAFEHLAIYEGFAGNGREC